MQRVGRNAAWLFLARLAAQGLLVAFTIVLAGRLGVAGLGGYAFLGSVVFLANVGTTFGTDMILIREIVGAGRLGLWPAALTLQLGLSALVIAVVWLVAPIVPGQGSDAVTALQVYAMALLPMAVSSVSGAVLRGAGRMGWYAVLGLAAAAVQLTAAWALIGPGASLTTVAVVLLAVQVVLAALGGWVCLTRVPGLRASPETALPAVAGLARSSAPIALLGVIGILYQRLGVFALSVLSGPAATGWFAASFRVVDASKSGHVALFGALYPAMAEAHGAAAATSAPSAQRGGAAADARGLDWSWRLSVLGAVAVSAGLLVGSPFLVGILYGPAFGLSVGALAVLSLTVVPSTVGTYQSLALLAARQERRVLGAFVAGVVALAGMLAVGIPLGGLMGACWAVLGGECVLATALVMARRRSVAPGLAARRHAPAPSPYAGVVHELPEPS